MTVKYFVDVTMIPLLTLISTYGVANFILQTAEVPQSQFQ